MLGHLQVERLITNIKEKTYIFMNETCLIAVGIRRIQQDLFVDRFLIYVIGSVCVQDKIRKQSLNKIK